MAHIINPKMTLSMTASDVTIRVNYLLRFAQHELHKLSTGSYATWFTEEITLYGGIQNLTYSKSLEHQEGTFPQGLTTTIPRHYFDKGPLDATVYCKIRIVPNPPVGATADTNSAIVPSQAVLPYSPRRRIGVAIAPAVGAMVVGAVASAAIRRIRAGNR